MCSQTPRVELFLLGISHQCVFTHARQRALQLKRLIPPNEAQLMRGTLSSLDGCLAWNRTPPRVLIPSPAAFMSLAEALLVYLHNLMQMCETKPSTCPTCPPLDMIDGHFVFFLTRGTRSMC